MTPSKTIDIAGIPVGGHNPFVLLSGPCQLESLAHARMMAEKIAEACAATGTKFIFKSSYDKANRTSLAGQRGLGIDEGLTVLSKIKDEFGCPILTDVHDTGQCDAAAQVADVIQIPAFLCRQTDLLIAAGNTGKAINIKKGQFLAPWDMEHVAAKVASTGNEKIMLCDRGTSFGYNTLVSDFRCLPIMGETGYPVVFDATHSVQQPGGNGTTSSGQRQFVPTLAKAAVAIGVSALFLETHQDPDTAPSDGPNMVPTQELAPLLRTLCAYDEIAKDDKK